MGKGLKSKRRRVVEILDGGERANFWLVGCYAALAKASFSRILAHSKSGLELHAFPIFCSLCIYDTVVSELKTNWKFRYLKIACFVTVKQNLPIFRSRDDIFMSGFGHVSFFAIRCEN